MLKGRKIIPKEKPFFSKPLMSWRWAGPQSEDREAGGLGSEGPIWEDLGHREHK